MYGTRRMEEARSCSYCLERFSDVIKLIPECGNSICGRCYESLKEDTNETTKKYSCPSCLEEHDLPENGLPDNRQFLKLLKSLRTPEKALSEEAKELKEIVQQIELEMKQLEAFNEREMIEAYCEQLAQQVGEAVESAVKHLNEIEQMLFKQISDYRVKCLANLGGESWAESRAELAALRTELDDFNARWKAYFTRIEVFEKESQIEAALVQSNEYLSAIQSLEEKMRMDALNTELLVFNRNSDILEQFDLIGTIENIAKLEENISEDFSLSQSILNISAIHLSTNEREKETKIMEPASVMLTRRPGRILQVEFLSDDRLVSCSGDKTINVWSVAGEFDRFQLVGHTKAVQTITFIPGNYLASGSTDGTIKIWDLDERKEMRTLIGHVGAIVSLRLLKSGKLASYSADDTIKIWDLHSVASTPVRTIKGQANSEWHLPLFGTLSNDNMVTCTSSTFGTEVLRVWDSSNGSLVREQNTRQRNACSLLVLASDQLAVGFQNGTIQIIDPAGKALSRTIIKAHKGVHALTQFSNRNLVSAGKEDSDYTIRVWSWPDLSLLQTFNTGHSDIVSSLCFSPDEKLIVSGSHDGTIKLWPIGSRSSSAS